MRNNDSTKKKHESKKLRLNLIFCVIMALLAFPVIYTINLNNTKKDFFHTHSNNRVLRTKYEVGKRGMILDRNNLPIAISSRANSIWISPQEFDVHNSNLNKIADLLDISLESIVNKYHSNPKRKFVYIKRHVPPNVTDMIKSLNVKGVYSSIEDTRHYPLGAATAQLVGFTNIDNKGLEGLEMAYDTWLSGKKGSRSYYKDLKGRNIQILKNDNIEHGNDLRLTIDAKLQYMTYKLLEQAVKKHKASKASAVVVEVATGEILSSTNFPSFNPNIPRKADDAVKNTAVTDTFEPGSVMKTFSLATVMEHNGLGLHKKVNTSPGKLILKNGVVSDLRDNGVLKVEDILSKSSNVGVAKLALTVPKHKLVEKYKLLGFGQFANSGFPGESPGVLQVKPKISDFEYATQTFGYGMSVTPLQLASAYAAIGGDGTRIPPTFIKNQQQEKIRVFTPEVAYKLRAMLAKVSESPLSKAKLKIHRVGGKSGTARKIKNKSYSSNSHVSFFAGLAPITNPKFAIVVMVDEPKREGYYGNSVAAPVFSKLANAALRLYNVSPDIVDTHGVLLAHNDD